MRYRILDHEEGQKERRIGNGATRRGVVRKSSELADSAREIRVKRIRGGVDL